MIKYEHVHVMRGGYGAPAACHGGLLRNTYEHSQVCGVTRRKVAVHRHKRRVVDNNVVKFTVQIDDFQVGRGFVAVRQSGCDLEHPQVRTGSAVLCQCHTAPAEYGW